MFEPTDAQITVGAVAMVQLCQAYRAKGKLLPSRREEARACLMAAAVPPCAGEWSSDFGAAPTEAYEFFLVRPKGLHPATGMVWHPTIVQRIDGQLYTSTNELEPVYFGQNEADDHPLKTALEWRHFPADWLTPSEAA